MYAGYMVANVGFFLLNPSLRNAVIYAVGWSIQIGRIYREERWLSQDPAYRSYVEAVRHRLIPGVY
jgi:protein-S-isoprenylcysteine O-methyltransferase Ste14